MLVASLPADGRLEVPAFDMVPGGKQVIGSIVGTREDLSEVFRSHRRGETRVIRESRRLEQVNECFDEVLSGRLSARLVFALRR